VCPVVTGRLKQEYPCEVCHAEEEHTCKKSEDLAAEVERLRTGWKNEERLYKQLREAIRKAGLTQQYLNGELHVFPVSEGHMWNKAGEFEARAKKLDDALQSLFEERDIAMKHRLEQDAEIARLKELAYVRNSNGLTEHTWRESYDTMLDSLLVEGDTDE
jgi:hypothetical protein